ncbi:MAG: hypothetical protein QM736_10925 [Vicinamibacterales bacterium]
MAKGATLMTDTTVTSRVLGSAWPSHMNKTVAETMHANIQKVGMPAWTEADQTLARALQREVKVPEIGLRTKIDELRGREEIPDEEKRGGGSDDIGDVSWNVPTVTLNYPANIAAGPGHNWSNAVSMATPIAHKGVTAGAKVQALTVLDLHDASRAGPAGVGLLQQRPDQEQEGHPAPASRGQAGDLVEQGDDGEGPAGDEEILTSIRPGTRPTSNSSASSIRPSARPPRTDRRTLLTANC